MIYFIEETDHTLELLLDLDDYTVFLNQDYWVKIEARKVNSDIGKPFGIKYSLTLHNSEGKRMLGFDNAHRRPGAASKEPHDHIHLKVIRPYTYTSASKLLEDFWKEVERFMKKEGIQL